MRVAIVFMCDVNGHPDWIPPITKYTNPPGIIIHLYTCPLQKKKKALSISFLSGKEARNIAKDKSNTSSLTEESFDTTSPTSTQPPKSTTLFTKFAHECPNGTKPIA